MLYWLGNSAEMLLFIDMVQPHFQQRASRIQQARLRRNECCRSAEASPLQHITRRRGARTCLPEYGTGIGVIAVVSRRPISRGRLQRTLGRRRTGGRGARVSHRAWAGGTKQRHFPEGALRYLSDRGLSITWPSARGAKHGRAEPRSRPGRSDARLHRRRSRQSGMGGMARRGH